MSKIAITLKLSKVNRNSLSYFLFFFENFLSDLLMCCKWPFRRFYETYKLRHCSYRIYKKLYFLIVLLYFNNIVFGQTGAIEVGIPDNEFYAHAQEKDNWCWAASIQMILEYNHVFKSQTEIVEKTFGKDYNGEIPNLGGSVQTISKNLNNWEVDYIGRPSEITSAFYSHPPSAEELVFFLKNKQPIYLSYKSSLSTNHAIVITTCRYKETGNGPDILDITVRDPWPSKENVRSDGLLKYNYSSFFPFMNYFWIVNARRKGHVSANSDLIMNCSLPFCIPLKKILEDFDNKFINVRGEKFSDGEYGFRSTVKFPNERSSYFFIGREVTYYYASFYRGSDINNSKLIFEDLKANFSLMGIPVEETTRVYSDDGNYHPERKTVLIELETGKVIHLNWTYDERKKEGMVSMKINTKEDSKFD